MPEKQLDKFANLAVINCTESAANTLTFKKLETGISLAEKVAWVIHRLDYIIASPEASTFSSTGDTIMFGLCVSNSFSTISVDDPSILDYNARSRLDYGTAATMIDFWRPAVRNDFTSFPSGGIIVPPVPLYCYAKGTGLDTAMTINMRCWYTLLKLSIDEYWELVEARRVIVS